MPRNESGEKCMYSDQLNIKYYSHVTGLAFSCFLHKNSSSCLFAFLHFHSLCLCLWNNIKILAYLVCCRILLTVIYGHHRAKLRKSTANIRNSVGFEVLTAVVMNVTIYCDITPCSPYVNRHFGGTHHLHLGNMLHAGFFLGWLSTPKMEVHPIRRFT
jgi:hypothetical protein